MILPHSQRLLTGVAGHVTPYDARYFAEDDARHRLLTHFEVASLEGFGCAHLPLAIRAAGAVLAYLQETQKGLLRQLTALETYSTTGFMTLDMHTAATLNSSRLGAVAPSKVRCCGCLIKHAAQWAVACSAAGSASPCSILASFSNDNRSLANCLATRSYRHGWQKL